MESDASHLRNLIERLREFDKTLMKYFGTSIIVEAGNERFEMNKAADEAEAFLNREGT
jgi:hypothetical protein